MLIKGQSPRSLWKLGKINKLYQGRDGVVRAAQVMQPNHNLLNRSLQDLFPLEVQDESLHENEIQKITSDNDTADNNIRERSTRKAAHKALEKILSTNDTPGAEDV